MTGSDKSLRPILIAGPTASGKSSLALEIASALGGVIINADALQVYAGWRVLTARPSREDEMAHPHHLYGHVPMDVAYSVGQWLRDLKPVLEQSPAVRPIIVGGTGLYFSALTEGLVDIPPIPDDVRAEGDTIRRSAPEQFAKDLQNWDQVILSRIDQKNPARMQRAWEVYRATGTPLSAWQANTGPADLPLAEVTAICLRPDPDWLNRRIARRFAEMLDQGAIEECLAARAAGLRPEWPSARALGATELLAYADNEMSQATAMDRATIATRQFAKRQRTWFRSRMGEWSQFDIGHGSTSTGLRDAVLAEITRT